MAPSANGWLAISSDLRGLPIDTAGGYLIQPGVRYRPWANWQWDVYATVIASPGGANGTDSETLDFADEMFVRATYFF